MPTEERGPRGPSERPPWGPTMKQLVTPRGLQALEQALTLYAPYTHEQLSEDPALRLQVAKEAAPLIDTAVEGYLLSITRRFSRKGVLRKDVLDILVLVGEAIYQKYPEHCEPGAAYSEAFVLNEIEGRLEGYYFTMIALNEDKHRELRKGRGKARRGSVRGRERRTEPVHYPFFNIVDRPELFEGAPHRSTSQKIRNFAELFGQIKEVWIPFLKGRAGKFNKPERATRESLRADNDRVAELLLAEADKEVPMCTAENNTLLEAKPLTMQFAPVDNPELGSFNIFSTQVGFFNEELGAAVAENRDFQEALRPQVRTPRGGIEQPFLVSIGEFPPVLLTRYGAEPGGLSLGPEALKLIAGTSLNYELLRKDIYWYVAQLTCRRPTLQKMYGDMFAPRERTVRPAGPRMPDEEEPEPNPDTEIVRRYPSGDGERTSPEARAQAIYGALEEGQIVDLEPEGEDEVIPGDVEEQVDETVEHVQRESSVVGYRRLLPLLWKLVTEDGVERIEISASKPSQKAKDNAAAAGKELRRGIEFAQLGQVVKPQDVPALLERFGAESLEELEARYPGNAFIRYESWTPPHRRGQAAHGVIETVKAAVEQV